MKNEERRKQKTKKSNEEAGSREQYNNQYNSTQMAAGRDRDRDRGLENGNARDDQITIKMKYQMSSTKYQVPSTKYRVQYKCCVLTNDIIYQLPFITIYHFAFTNYSPSTIYRSHSDLIRLHSHNLTVRYSMRIKCQFVKHRFTDSVFCDYCRQTAKRRTDFGN